MSLMSPDLLKIPLTPRMLPANAPRMREKISTAGKINLSLSLLSPDLEQYQMRIWISLSSFTSVIIKKYIPKLFCTPAMHILFGVV